MNTLDTNSILAGLEEYIDELPAKRRRRPADDTPEDDTPETENYAGINPAAVMVHCTLTHEDQVTIMLRLWDLGRARGAAECGAICREIWALVGLSTDLPSYEDALTRNYDATMARRKGGAK